MQEENIIARKNTTEKKLNDKAKSFQQGEKKSNEDKRDYKNYGMKNKGNYHHYPLCKDFTSLVKLPHEVFLVIENKRI